MKNCEMTNLDDAVKGFDENYFGTPYGQKKPDDATFLLWFDQQMRDPFWVLAWQFVEEGKEDIKRWEELTGQKVPTVEDMLPVLVAAGAVIDPEKLPKWVTAEV